MSPNQAQKPKGGKALHSTRWHDGMLPKELPLRGEDLMPGYQYELDPAARRAIDDAFGIRGVPTYVECLKARRAPCKRVCTTTNLETGEVTTTEHTEPEQLATFRAYLGGTKLAVFTLDLPALVERRAALVAADLVKDTDSYSRSDERPEARKTRAPRATQIDVAKLFDF